MKNSTLSTFLVMLVSITLFLSCAQKEEMQLTVDLTYPDGTKESFPMVKGNMLLIHHGDQHYLAKAVNETDSTLSLEVTNYGIAMDSMRGERSVKKMGSATTNLSLNRKAMIDPSGTVHIELKSVARMDAGKTPPKGACAGVCCEATCYSVFCCGDSDECKNTPCDCKPTTACPGQDPTPSPARFFDMFLAGKDVMVLESVQDTVR